MALLQAAGWDVCVVATQAALAWIDAPALHEASGHPVRSGLRSPDDPEFEPRGDAVLVAPATFNTINRCAAGMNDSLALGLINEALGTPAVPLAFVPWVNSSLGGHPAYDPSIARLEDSGARIMSPNVDDNTGFDDACTSASRWLATTLGHAVPPTR
jgi:phosphopantothenoylcysteine synthetase/decarboxylase